MHSSNMTYIDGNPKEENVDRRDYRRSTVSGSGNLTICQDHDKLSEVLSQAFIKTHLAI